MTEALVTPSVLSWARRRRKLEVDELAAKLNVRPTAIDGWESGEQRPTFRAGTAVGTGPVRAIWVPLPAGASGTGASPP